MPSTLITYSTTLEAISCGECEIPFAIPVSLHKRLKETGAKFYCPNGHHICYLKTEADSLRAKLAQEQRWRESAQARLTHERDQRMAAERSASAYKGRVTRLKNRAAAGVCPCCNRHFENVERHMNSKHPDFRDSPEPAPAR